jgi:hypothetical protein
MMEVTDSRLHCVTIVGEWTRAQLTTTYSNGTETTHYVGGRLEKTAATSTPTLVYWRHYVPTPGGATIIVSRNSNSSGANTGSGGPACLAAAQ